MNAHIQLAPAVAADDSPMATLLLERLTTERTKAAVVNGILMVDPWCSAPWAHELAVTSSRYTFNPARPRPTRWRLERTRTCVRCGQSQRVDDRDEREQRPWDGSVAFGWGGMQVVLGMDAVSREAL